MMLNDFQQSAGLAGYTFYRHSRCQNIYSYFLHPVHYWSHKVGTGGEEKIEDIKTLSEQPNWKSPFTKLTNVFSNSDVPSNWEAFYFSYPELLNLKPSELCDVFFLPIGRGVQCCFPGSLILLLVCVLWGYPFYCNWTQCLLGLPCLFPVLAGSTHHTATHLAPSWPSRHRVDGAVVTVCAGRYALVQNCIHSGHFTNIYWQIHRR